MNFSKCQIKKNLKKIDKIKLRLSDKNGIQFSNEPTEIIVIANAGLSNDVKRHELETNLSPFNDHIKELITPSNLTFAIVICNTSISSSIIVNELQSFHILTPDFKNRTSVNGFCIYAKVLPIDICSEIINLNTSKPPGLIITDNFLNIEEEELLRNYFVNLPEKPTGNLKQRTVLHFGYEFNYNNNLVDYSKPLTDKPIPKCCVDLLSRLEQQTGKSYSDFNQLTVNIYQPGDGIPSHIDTHSVFTDEIISISLNSDIMMEFISQQSHQCVNIDLKARSMCIMTGESRYLWKHGIASRKSDLIFDKERNTFEKRQRSMRISLTFRQVKVVRDCWCKWIEFCDFNRQETNEFCPKKPQQLEEEFVHKVYDNIATHFSSTRHSMWREVRQFIEKQPLGSIGLDIGCGNGKYFPAIIKQGFLLPTDCSLNLLKIATETHKIDAIQSNCLQLPYRSASVDYFICIAVLHHLSTAERRREAIERMVKILRKGGQGLIYVWAQDQQNNGVKSKYLDKKKKKNNEEKIENENINKDSIVQENALPIHCNRTQFSNSDMLVPWSKKNDEKCAQTSEILTRYYHLFQHNELENVCLSVDGVRIADSWYDSGNWAVVVEKC